MVGSECNTWVTMQAAHNDGINKTNSENHTSLMGRTWTVSGAADVYLIREEAL